MNQEIKQKWVDALRSGEYKQITGHLMDSNGYCCLGVLAEICNWKYIPIHDTSLDMHRDIISEDTQDELIHLNDNENRDFNYIANYIEENL